MAKTYLHSTANSAASDQDWVSDVTEMIKNHMQWDGIKVTPKADTIIFNKAQSHGIKVDTENPTWPWVDLLGQVHIDESAASNKPTYALTGKGSTKAYQFIINDQIYIKYHIPHDYAPGTDLYIHAHWFSKDVSPGTVTWAFEHSYAKSHNQMNFTEAKTVKVSQDYSNQYMHMLSEVQLSVNGGDATKLDTDLIEPDGIINTRAYLDTNTMSSSPFLLLIDIHYQSTGVGTKNSSPNFYS